jgi:hypothetical protein
MIAIRELASLHLSAASGLVRAGDFTYAIADDEHHLATFTKSKAKSRKLEPGDLVYLIPGELPAGKKKRKAAKPDFEALALLPRFARYPNGALLALGSGSRPNRQTAVLLGLDEKGAITGKPILYDFADFYRCLREHVGELNIEGAVAAGESLRLFQRGNKGTVNQVVEMDLPPFLAALSAQNPIYLGLALKIRSYDLGRVKGVPLCFTDAAPLDRGRYEGGIVFTAVAEDTDNSYDDGQCLASAVGVMRADGSIAFIERLDAPLKVEGVTARVKGKGEKEVIKLRMVTDADDRDVPAMLVKAELRYS